MSKVIFSGGLGSAVLADFDVSVDGAEVDWADPDSMTGGTRLVKTKAGTYTLSEIEVVDSKRYFDEGARFLQGEEQVFAFRTPGYPLFVAYAGGLKPNLVALLQALLGLLTCGLVYWGALRLFGRPVARWATLFLALDMTTIIYGNFLLAEALFTLVLTATLVVLLSSESPRNAAAAGVLLAAACYVRPVGLPLALLCPLLIWVIFKDAKRAVLLFAVAWLLLAPWFFRQQAVFDRFMFSSVTSVNLLFYNAAHVEAELTGEPIRPGKSHMTG